MATRHALALLASVVLLAQLCPSSFAQAPAPQQPPPAARPDEPPTVPIGLNAYRQWQMWPYQRLGVRAYMRSTYDRRGRNEGADASHFLYQLADDFNVTLDVEGHGGFLYFARYNHWHGSPWRYVVDGRETIVKETSTADPNKPVPGSTFIPPELFPKPLAWTWSDTKGADLSWVPIGFEKSFQMAYSRTRYGTGYYVYHQYAPGTRLSQPVKAWEAKTPPPDDVRDLISRSGSQLAKPLVKGELSLPAGGVAHVTTGKGAAMVLRGLTFSVPVADAVNFGRARLRITWDGRKQPSVDAPIALFFGAGTLYNRDGREHLVKAFPVNIRYADGRVHLACYFPMPFFKSASIDLTSSPAQIKNVRWTATFAPLAMPPNHVGYFHATYRDHPSPQRGKDLVLLDTRGTEGSQDWTG